MSREAGSKAIVLHAAVIAALFALGFVLPAYHHGVLARVMVLAVFAMGYNLLFGYAGLLSLGHAMFFAAGLYGAGLTMSTVDVVTFVGGKPANFCDLGGGGDAHGVVDALEVITRDPQVRAIFFNIFGGITRCDEVARGILQALEQMGIEDPIVVRLDGTNAEEGRRLLLEAAKPNVHAEATMLDGARRAVELAGAA